MKPLEYYKTTDVPFVTKLDFTTTYWYKGGELFAKQLPDWPTPRRAPSFLVAVTAIDVLEAAVMERCLDTNAYNHARGKYNGDIAARAAQFRDDVIAHSGLENNRAAAVIYALAYAQGHDQGHARILEIFEDLVAFIGELDAAREGDK